MSQQTNQPNVSALLAGYLLKGWTLLGQTCPVCYTPLIREKHSSSPAMLCVSCNLQVIKQKDVKGDIKQQIQDDNKQQDNQQQQQQQSQQPSQQQQSSVSSAPSNNLESGLVSLSSHPLFARLTGELRAANGDEPEDADQDYEHVTQLANQTQYQQARDAMTEEELEEEMRAVSSQPGPSLHSRLAQSLLSANHFSSAPSATRSASAAPAPRPKSPPLPDNISKHMSQLNTLSSKLGAMMLQGYTLLGDMCDECDCPLVQKRSTANTPPSPLLCCNCNVEYKKVDNHLERINPASNTKTDESKSAVTAPTSSARSVDNSEVDDDSSDDEDEMEMELRRIQQEEEHEKRMRNQTNSLNSQIQGLSSLSTSSYTSFPPMPSDFSEYNDNPTKFKQDHQAANVRVAPATSSSSSSASSLLSARMLSGYVLLSECCPSESCYTPLVQRKGEPLMECVACGTFFRKDKEGNLSAAHVSPTAATAASSSSQCADAGVKDSKVPTSFNTPAKRPSSPPVVTPPPLSSPPPALPTKKLKTNDNVNTIHSTHARASIFKPNIAFTAHGHAPAHHPVSQTQPLSQSSQPTQQQPPSQPVVTQFAVFPSSASVASTSTASSSQVFSSLSTSLLQTLSSLEHDLHNTSHAQLPSLLTCIKQCAETWKVIHDLEK